MAGKSGPFWLEHHGELVRLWGVAPAFHIAEKLGTTTCAVIGRANRCGLPPISEAQKNAWAKAGPRARVYELSELEGIEHVVSQ